MFEILVAWVLGQATTTSFKIMVAMFAVIGTAELLWPALKVPGRHYVLNVGYALINTFAFAAIAPLSALALGAFIRQATEGWIDLQVLSVGGIAGAALAMILGAAAYVTPTAASEGDLQAA